MADTTFPLQRGLVGDQAFAKSWRACLMVQWAVMTDLCMSTSLKRKETNGAAGHRLDRGQCGEEGVAHHHVGHVVVQLVDGVDVELLGAKGLLQLLVGVLHGAHLTHRVFHGLQGERGLLHVELLVVQLVPLALQHLLLLQHLGAALTFQVGGSLRGVVWAVGMQTPKTKVKGGCLNPQALVTVVTTPHTRLMVQVFARGSP